VSDDVPAGGVFPFVVAVARVHDGGGGDHGIRVDDEGATAFELVALERESAIDGAIGIVEALAGSEVEDNAGSDKREGEDDVAGEHEIPAKEGDGAVHEITAIVSHGGKDYREKEKEGGPEAGKKVFEHITGLS